MQKQPPFHICFVAPTIYPYYQGAGCGGAELQIKMLADALAEQGYLVTVLTDSTNQPPEEYFGKVKVIKCPLRFLGGHKLYFFSDTFSFVRQIRSLKPDFLLLKTPNALLFQLVLAAKCVRNIKTIKIFASDGDCHPPHTLAGALYRIGLYFADGLVFQTNFQKNIYEQQWQTSNPVIRNIFIPPEKVIGEKCPKDIELLWVGALTDAKQPDKLLELIRLMPHRRFTIISKGTENKYRQHESILISQPNVDFLGKVPFEQIQNYFNRAKILLCTSKTEGFPNTFLQGWYGGCAIVSLQYPCDGILAEKKCGYVSGSTERMCDDIETLLNNNKLREQINANGRAYMRQEHDRACIINNYMRFLCKLRSIPNCKTM